MKKAVFIISILLVFILSISIVSIVYAHEEDEAATTQETSLSASRSAVHWLVDHYRWIAGAVIIVALIITLIKSIKGILKLALSWGALLIALYIIYSVLYTYSLPEQERETVITCSGNNCTKSMHVHAYVDVQLCGKELRFPLEEGDLDAPHTHKEKNRVHIHDNFAFENRTQKILNTTKLTLGYFFDQIKIRFTENCIEKYCNGDLCKGKPGHLFVWTNVTPATQHELMPAAFRNYVWHDEEKIKIRFNEE